MAFITTALLHEKLFTKVSNVLINLLGEMLQEFIHLVAFVLYHLVSNIRCFGIDFFEIMISQSADFFGLLFGNMACVSKSRCEHSGHVFNFLFSH